MFPCTLKSFTSSNTALYVEYSCFIKSDSSPSNDEAMFAINIPFSFRAFLLFSTASYVAK